MSELSGGATAEDVLNDKKAQQSHIRAVLVGLAGFVVVMSLLIAGFTLAFHVHDLNSHKVEVGLEKCIESGHIGYDAAHMVCYG